jgi:hypothetical protein
MQPVTRLTAPAPPRAASRLALLTWCTVCLAAVAAGPKALAAERSPALDRVSLWLGASRAGPEAEAGVVAFDQSFETGTFPLTHGRRTLPRARVELVLGARHGLSFDYYELRSGRSAEVRQPFRFEGIDYTVDARVSGEIDVDVGQAAYRFWLGSGDTVFGLGAGAGVYRVDLAVSGVAPVNGRVFEAGADYATTAVAPLLTLGVRHRLSDQVRLYADASGIRRTGGRLTGHIYTAGVGVEWFPWRNIGVGAEHGTKRVRLVREKDAAEARLDLRLDKPTLFLRARF